MCEFPRKKASSLKSETLLLLFIQKENLCVLNQRHTCTVIAPAIDSGAPPATPEEPLKNLVYPVKQIFTEYLNINASNGDTIDEGFGSTYKEEERQVSTLVSVTGSTS